jgi:vitamin B12 transporter
MRPHVLLCFVVEALLGILVVHSANAQTKSSATIRGTLTDPSGAAVIGAAIEAQSLDSPSDSTRTQSGPEGKFSMTLPPARYHLSIKHPSFEKAEQEFTLAANEMRTWDVRLALERLSSTVVVTASAQPETTATTSAHVDVITKQDIEERQTIFLLPMLSSSEGVSIARLGPFGGIGSLFLDGGNSYYTKVFIDGAPVNEPGGAVDFSNLTLDNVDKIEIVHGASSALFGSDAMAGVIQIFTHRGTTTTPVIEVEGDGGSFDTGRGSAQISGLAGAFDYSAAAAYFDTNGQGPGDYFRDTVLSGNFGWRFSDSDTLRLALRNTTSDAGQPGQTLLASVPFAVDIGQHSDLHDFSGNLMWDLKPSEHWDNQLSGSESRFQDFEVSPAFDFSSISKFNRADLEDRLSYLFPGGGVTAGYVFEVENGPVDHRHNQAGYLEARYKVGHRLNLVAGGRAEANSFFGTRVVPRVGASYALRFGHDDFWGATKLRASYGEGIVEPEMFPAGCTPILSPEQSTTADAGIDQFFASDRVKLSVTYFHNDFHNIVSFASGGASQNCPAFGGSFFNTDKARAYGSNASFEVKATRWLNFAGNYAYDDSLVIKSPNATDPALVPGNRLFLRPLNSANLVANAHFRRMNWNLAGTYVGRTADSDFLSTIINDVCTGPCIKSNPSWVRWDLANSINLGHGVSTIARVENLFNRHYEDAVGYPALRLNYRLGLKYVWGRE